MAGHATRLHGEGEELHVARSRLGSFVCVGVDRPEGGLGARGWWCRWTHENIPDMFDGFCEKRLRLLYRISNKGYY